MLSSLVEALQPTHILAIPGTLGCKHRAPPRSLSHAAAALQSCAAPKCFESFMHYDFKKCPFAS